MKTTIESQQAEAINTFGIRPPPRPTGSELPLAEGSRDCEPTLSVDLFFSAEFSADVLAGTSMAQVTGGSPDKLVVPALVSSNCGCCCIPS